MVNDLLFVAVGLIALVLGGEALVRGASALALRLGITPLIVGLTVVAFGTSAPELLVSISAARAGQPGIALGNVVGSNIANILLVLGLPALLSPIITRGHDLRSSWLMMMGASVALMLLSLDGVIGRWGGGLLLAGLAAMILTQIRAARAGQLDPELPEGADPAQPVWKTAALLVGGLVALPLGAGWLVEGASALARAAGVSETVIGLTLVALGTSLPELATSVAAALRGRADLALGNVVGSNLFNILCILGLTATVTPIHVPPDMMARDYWVMLAVALAIGPFLWLGRPITRVFGGVFIAGYAAYVALLIL